MKQKHISCDFNVTLTVVNIIQIKSEINISVIGSAKI